MPITTTINKTRTINSVTLTRFALVALACALAPTMASLTDRELDCSAVEIEAPLEQYKDVCPLIASWDKVAAAKLKPLEKWDYLEKCTCNLLHHQLAWESLMTHEVETVYHVARKIIQLKDEQLEKATNKELDDNLVTKHNLIFREDTDGVMYFWDRFTALLLNTKAGDRAGSELSKLFTEIYTDTYYKPEEYRILFKGEGETMNFRQNLSTTCRNLLESFGPFILYLNNLKQLSENPRYAYRVVSYDQNLYRLMVSIRMCQFLTLSGVVIRGD